MRLRNALLISAGVFLGLVLAARAQQHVVSATIVPAGFCQLSGVSPVSGLSACSGGIPAGSTLILVVDESASVRWRDDGTNPTSSVGMLLTDTANLPWEYKGDLTKIKFVAVSGTPVLDVSFYKTGY